MQPTGNPEEPNFFGLQELMPTPVNELASASLWSWHDVVDEPIILIEWTYDDGSIDDYLAVVTLDGWQQYDLADKLDPTKTLTSLRVWGYTSTKPKPDVTLYDDFEFCRKR